MASVDSSVLVVDRGDGGASIQTPTKDLGNTCVQAQLCPEVSFTLSTSMPEVTTGRAIVGEICIKVGKQSLSFLLY